jgi:hypothetical protein
MRVILAALVLLLSVPAFGWEIPLELKENWGQGGLRHVSGGVPLLPGQAKDVSELRLAVKKDGALVAVPAQFRALARWWRKTPLAGTGDNSIRWVLVDFEMSVRGSHPKTYYLTNAKLDAPAPKQPCAVAETDDEITVTTGPAKFVVNKKKFAFLDHAYIDADKDGAFAADEDMLDGSPDLGLVIEGRFGEKYYGSESVLKVEVIEKGPVRVKIRARGTLRGRGGVGYSRGMYDYDVFLNFYAGGTEVYSDVILGNSPKISRGSPTFEDASLLLKLAGGATRYRVYGASRLDGSFGDATSLCLYQDSNGSETWKSRTGSPSKAKIVRFRGYKLWKRSGGKLADGQGITDDKDIYEGSTEVTGGDNARGLVQLYNKRGGMVIHTKDFWQQFPKAAEISKDGTVRIGLFPRESRVPHFLEDTTGKGHEIIFQFYSTKQRTAYASDGKHTWAHVFADNWDYRVLPRPTLKHISATGALNDVGPMSVPKSVYSAYPWNVTMRRLFMTDRYHGNGYGWQVWGERWLSMGGHSRHGARQPIKEDSYLYRWYVTGDKGWLEVGDDRGRLFRDVRTHRVDDQDPFGFASWGEFRKHYNSEDYTERTKPKDDEIKKYSAGKWGRPRWELPNPAHMTLDLLYDRWLLFGDDRAFEGARMIAGNGMYTTGKAHVHRATGWSWRVTERFWELTGDKGAERVLKQIIAAQSPLIGTSPKGPNSWFYQVYTRAAAMTALHMRDRAALDICKALSTGGQANARYDCTLWAVLYHLTGDEKYKTQLLGKDNGAGLLIAGNNGDWPATAHWLVNQKPNPLK